MITINTEIRSGSRVVLGALHTQSIEVTIRPFKVINVLPSVVSHELLDCEDIMHADDTQVITCHMGLNLDEGRVIFFRYAVDDVVPLDMLATLIVFEDF